MGQVIQYGVGDIIRLTLEYKKNSIGQTGLDCRVALREWYNNRYFDFSDNTFKASGWIQKYLNLDDFGNGTYHKMFDSWDAINSRMFLFAEYECTTPGSIARDTDLLVFGFAEPIESGRWKIDDATNQMIFFAPDGVTPMLKYNLRDIAGNPTIEHVTERVLAP
jgi:hypothetical protein